MTTAHNGKLSAFAALWTAISGQRRAGSPGLLAMLTALPRMIRAALSGDYPGLGRTRLLWMGAALLYIVSPFDLVPEGIFTILGLGDDAVVLSWLAGAVLAETEAFLQWESPEGRHDDDRVRPTVVKTETV